MILYVYLSQSQFLRIIKETAIDCSLYVAKHNEKENSNKIIFIMISKN